MQTVRDVILKGLEELGKKQGLRSLQLEAFVGKGEDIFRAIPEYHNVKRLKTNRSTAVDKVHKTLIERNVIPLNLNNFSELELSIISKAATIYNLTLEDLISRTRKRDPIDCRNQINAIFVLYLQISAKKCGEMFNKDHSTILNSLKRHSDFIDTDRVYLSRFIQLLTEVKAAHPEEFADLDPTQGIKSTQLKTLLNAKW